MIKIKKIIYGFIVVSVSCALFTSCNKKEEDPPVEFKGVEVEAGSPQNKTMTEYLSLNGVTIFNNQEIVRATFAGYIKKVHKALGDYVKEGDLLFTLKTKEAEAIANDHNVNSQFSGSVNVYAHSNGILNEINFHSGDYVVETDKIANIIQPQSLRINLNVPYANMQTIRTAKNFIVQLPDGKEVNSRIDKIFPVVDPVNQTQMVTLILSSNMNLPSNLNVNVKIPVKRIENAMVLPKSAIVTDETQTEFWVMKIINDNLAVKINIKKGIESDSLIQIVEPVFNSSDKFIIKGAYGLADTTKIVIKK